MIHFKDEEEEVKEPSSITYSYVLAIIEYFNRWFQNTNKRWKVQIINKDSDVIMDNIYNNK